MKMGPMFTDFWCVKSTHLGGTSPYSLHMWSYSPSSPPPLDSLKGHPNNFDFINLWNASLWEFRNQTMEKCWKGAPLWKGNISWNAWVKRHPAGAPSARVPAGLPTLSPNRSYATDQKEYSNWMAILSIYYFFSKGCWWWFWYRAQNF